MPNTSGSAWAAAGQEEEASSTLPPKSFGADAASSAATHDIDALRHAQRAMVRKADGICKRREMARADHHAMSRRSVPENMACPAQDAGGTPLSRRFPPRCSLVRRSPALFARRRARSDVVYCHAAGLCSRRAAAFVVAWEARILRGRRPVPHRPGTPAHWRAVERCAARRLRARSPATAAGRFANRTLRGFVWLRWHDAVATARVARL